MSAPPSLNEPWSLAGKTGIVSGGSRGIGRAIAIHLARKRLQRLAITYLTNSEAADETLEECRALGVEKAAAIQADALDPEFGPKVVSQALQQLDTAVVDILINNAMLSDKSKAVPVKDTPIQVFSAVMQANVYAPLSLTVSLLQHLPSYGGRVVNISSMLAYQANTDPAIAYGASKAALQSYTRSFAQSYSRTTQATFNSVVAGLTATESIKSTYDLMPDGYLDKQIEDTTAAERIGQPDDIAYIVGFICSEEGRWMNGAAISANGGNRLIMASLG